MYGGKKYIITGAPGTGKSTLITHLKRHVPCMEEVAREVIAEEQAHGRHGTPWGDILRFAGLVERGFTQALATHTDSVFFDRSLVDLEAYLQLGALEVPIGVRGFPHWSTFERVVFLAPTWEQIYQQDAQRLQDFSYCEALERQLIATYTQHGCCVVPLPKGTPQQRIAFMQNILGFPRSF